MKGFSIVWHGKFFYLGKYIKGVFSDNNANLDPEIKKGWGFKFDLFFAHIRRPVPRIFDKRFWTGKPLISDIPREDWEDYFPEKIAGSLERKRQGEEDLTKVHDFHFGVCNPWKGLYWFVLKVGPFIPLPFLSISTPWKSVYIGFKSSKIDPFYKDNILYDEGDVTWTTPKDEELAEMEEPRTMYRAAVPSTTIRSKR